jgi:acetyltransferase-like isoleucine patch superfamily enzyme
MSQALGTVLRLRRRVRLVVFLWRLRLLAAAQRVQLDLDVAPDLELGRRVTVQLLRGTRNRVAVGPGCRILDDVFVQLKGATLELGPRVEIRRGTVLNLSGRFACAGGNIISYENVIHCAESIELDAYASTNEYVSLIDSTHHHDGPHPFFYENVSSAPISIGRNTWICNKSSVLLGVTIGHNSVVASHAVVNRDVPDGVVVGGIPAKYLADRKVDGPALELFERRPALV